MLVMIVIDEDDDDDDDYDDDDNIPSLGWCLRSRLSLFATPCFIQVIWCGVTGAADYQIYSYVGASGSFPTRME